jgi:SNF2 family DNA or RNA helicase
LVRKTLSLIKSCSKKHREIIDSMLQQVPWSSRQQSFAMYLIEQYLPHINIYELQHEIVKEEMLMDAREYTKEQVKVVDKIKSGDFTEFEVPLQMVLFDHQKKAYAIGTSLDGAAFLMEMGTGKTLAAIAVAGKRFLDGKINRLLAVAPLSVLHVWESEFNKHAKFPYYIRKQSLDGEDKKDVLNVFIVSYETSWRVGDDIISWKPDMVIADESQRIKNTDSKRTKFLHELGNKVKYKLILTGTPVTQSPIDLFAQYKFLNSSIFGDGITKFKDRYAELDGFGKVLRYKNLDDLSDRAYTIAYRVRKDEVLDLPPFIDEIMYCELNESRVMYDQIRNEMKVAFAKGNVNYNEVLARLQKLSQIAGGFYSEIDGYGERKIVQVGTEKLSLLRNIVSDLPTDKKFIIFCRYLSEISAVSQLLDEMQIKNQVITGATKMELRKDILERFKIEEELRCIVLNIQVGSVGIDLTAADTMIFYSHSYSYADYEQARARIHRTGQVNKCMYIHLVAKDTIDERVMESLEEKKDVAQQVVDRVNRGVNRFLNDINGKLIDK